MTLRADWTAEDIDDVLAGTFPASDPPAWTPGVARVATKTTAGADDLGITDAEVHKLAGALTP